MTHHYLCLFEMPNDDPVLWIRPVRAVPLRRGNKQNGDVIRNGELLQIPCRGSQMICDSPSDSDSAIHNNQFCDSPLSKMTNLNPEALSPTGA